MKELEIRKSIESAKKCRTETAYNCAQSVIAAFADKTGLTEDQALRVSSCFGGGMGVGSVCGALTGALMVLGTLYPALDGPTKASNRKITQEFIHRFEAQFGYIDCRDLKANPAKTGTPIATELLGEGKHCDLMIYTAIELLHNYLEELEKE